MAKLFLTVDRITVRLRDKPFLPDSSWQIQEGEQWAVLGPNGSGKSTLVRALWGGVPLRNGRILLHFADPILRGGREAVGYVSFEIHQRLAEREELREELRAYAGRPGEGTAVREVILSGIVAHRPLAPADEGRLRETAELLGLAGLLTRSFASLSTGEGRKALIARALLKSPRLLILDEPFEGLDEGARRSLAQAIDLLMAGPLQVILVAHRLEEVVPGITHVLFVKDGRLFRHGPKEAVLTSEGVSALYGCRLGVKRNNGRYYLASGGESAELAPVPLPPSAPAEAPEVLVEMEEATVRYGGGRGPGPSELGDAAGGKLGPSGPKRGG